MIITHKLSLDFQNRTAKPRLAMVQCDTDTRAIEIGLTNGGTAWTPENLGNVFLRYRKSDGTGGNYDTLPDGTRAWNAAENRITIRVAPQVLTVPGLVEVQAVLISKNQSIATFSFQIVVEEDPSGGISVSENYVNWSEWAKTKLDSLLEEARSSGDFNGACYIPEVDAEGNLSWTNSEGMNNPASVNLVELIAGKINGDILQGNMAGHLNMNGYKVTAMGAPVSATDAATKGYTDTAVKKAVPRNLLDNSDFTNPVNQRGATSASQFKYFIDRWYCGSVGNGVTLISNGIKVDAVGHSSNPYLRQWLAKKLPDGEYTMVAYMADNTKGYAIFTVLNSVVTVTARKQPAGLYFNPNYSANDGLHEIVLTFLRSHTEAVTVSAVALYKGAYTEDTIPEYHPKGYGAELTECLRYFYLIPASNYASFPTFVGGSRNARITVTTPVPMRAVPTVSVAAIGSVTSYLGTKNVLAESVSVNAMASNLVTLNMTATSDLTASESGVTRFNTDVTFFAEVKGE